MLNEKLFLKYFFITFCFLIFNTKVTENSKDIFLFNHELIKSNTGLNINKICQYKVAKQSHGVEGGGSLSCGYHALKNGIIIATGLDKKFSQEELSHYLKSKKVVKEWFGESNSKWRTILKEKDFEHTNLHGDEIKAIVGDIIHQPNVDVDNLYITPKIRIIFIGDKIDLNNNDIIWEYNNYANCGSKSFYDLINDIKGKKDIIGILLVNQNNHWYSCILDSNGHGLSIYLADSFNSSKIDQNKFLQVMQILDPVNLNLFHNLIKKSEDQKEEQEKEQEEEQVKSESNLKKGIIVTATSAIALLIGCKLGAVLLEDEVE